jgi:hypothetical protein
MKIADGIKYKKGTPYFIPNCSRADLPEFFVQNGFKRGVEIGVSWAENIIGYCEAGLEIYGIDPWKDSEDNIYRKIVSIPGGKTIDDVYNMAVERTNKYPNCKLIRKLSMDALVNFEDRSLDFVYIDGNHGFGYVAMDIAKWTSKVKKGGIIAGHDYLDTIKHRNYRHVRYVVDAFASSNDFANWYVLGRKEDEKHDRALSWLMIKHW